jgi:glycosyltransferase involved in cell wall biosynthesis
MTAVKPKLCILLNMIAPARVRLYSALAEHFELLVLHGGTEGNRDTWRHVGKTLPNATIVRAWGWQIPIIRRERGQFFDRRYIHITPGYIWHLLKFRPAVVISNEIGLRTIIALMYGTLFRVPVWVWWGGTLHTERKISAVRKILRSAISRRARHWISYGQTSTEYLLSLGVRADTILEIQNAVDESRFATRPEPVFYPEPRPVLLCVGQLVARKGVSLLLHAAAALQKEGRKFSLLLVGSGPDEQILKQLAQDLGLSNVHFCAAQKPEVMPSIYRSGDVLVFPTLEDPWGLVANEAIFSGLPVLCSKYAGCACELFPNENLFDPENPEEFKEKLRATLAGRLMKSDPGRLKTIAQIVTALIHALEQSMDNTLSFRAADLKKGDSGKRIQAQGIGGVGASDPATSKNGDCIGAGAPCMSERIAR